MSKKSDSRQAGLPVLHDRAAGIDIGSRFHVVAVTPGLTDQPVQTFRVFTADLQRMADWLVSIGIKTVAMESTGVYWVPAFEILESRSIEVILANAREARAVPGRKSDINDAQWLQQLHACGLLRASFRPGRDIAALRVYLRQRERLLDYCAAHIQHMQKALTLMNLQLHHVVSDITGATGMKIIRAIVGGQRDPQVLAMMRDVRCKASIETVSAALVGNYQPEHVFALTQALALYDFYQARIDECDERIENALAMLNADKSYPDTPLPKPRHRTKQPNEIRFDVRSALYQLTDGLDPNSRHRSVRGTAFDCGMRHGFEPVANGQALHVMAHPVAGLQDQWRQGVICTHQKNDEPSDGAPSLSGGNGGANQHGTRSLLSSARGSNRQGEGRDCHGAKDRRVVL
jgi:transposase